MKEAVACVREEGVYACLPALPRLQANVWAFIVNESFESNDKHRALSVQFATQLLTDKLVAADAVVDAFVNVLFPTYEGQDYPRLPQYTAAYLAAVSPTIGWDATVCVLRCSCLDFDPRFRVKALGPLLSSLSASMVRVEAGSVWSSCLPWCFSCFTHFFLVDYALMRLR
jgi:hypothetical protein